MNDAHEHEPAFRVAELFAGVGGFRQGLASANAASRKENFQVVWSNQYEPGCKKQHAAQVYAARWGSDGLINRDINEVLDSEELLGGLHASNPNMLVGGFPCQDYSVARPLSQSAGIEGKKGVLWWAIHKVLHARSCAPVKYLMFENVDRLLNTPSSCRGRDFAVILSSLQSLGYAIEWRNVNSAEYGFPQRRKRVFILAYHSSTEEYAKLRKASLSRQPLPWITEHGTLARALPAAVKPEAELSNFALPTEILSAQETYTPVRSKSRFQTAGFCVEGMVWTAPVQALAINTYEEFVGQLAPMTLGDVTSATNEVPDEYFINSEAVPRWQYLKGAKAVQRVKPDGFTYVYPEGAMAFPDHLDRPARTIITSEGGRSASRTSHAVLHVDGRLRRLTPEELEALNGFPRGFTALEGISARKRAFMMGNALVTGLVAAIGKTLASNSKQFDRC